MHPNSQSGLQQFAAALNPSAIEDILSWTGDPELGRIVANLKAHTESKAFFDSYAEAMVARQLLARKCKLKFEVPTPNGRRCDFEVAVGDERFFLHVKRLDSNRRPQRMLAVSSRLRMLERIARPYVVQVRWHAGVSDEHMQQLVAQAEEFIVQARIGDEMRARDDDGREIGGVRIIAPWEGKHVSVTIGLPSGFIDQAPRFRRLLHRAHMQFMPKGLNVILIGSGHDDDESDFENALLGSHIERWDAFPPRGKRIAHGRAEDGFWRGNRFDDSHVAGWFAVNPNEDALRSHLWIRANSSIDVRVKETLQRLF